MHAYGLAQLSELINHLGAASLSSQSQLYDGIQYSLSPRSQWKNDVTYWFATMSAALQASYLNTVIGPNNSIFDDIRVTPRNDVEQDFCNSQVCKLLHILQANLTIVRRKLEVRNMRLSVFLESALFM